MESRPALLFDGKYRWDWETLTDFAKDSFQGFKEAYKGQVDAAKWAKLQMNEQTNHRAAQRKEVHQANILVVEVSLTMDPGTESQLAA